MRGELIHALVMLLLACDTPPVSDGESYAAALANSTGFEAATTHCARIEDSDLQGDCRVAVMEIWSRLDPADCDQMGESLWRDECLFLLGERHWRAGDLKLGLETCEQTRFRRNCGWHLIQDEVQASLEMSAIEAEERIIPLADSKSIPDAALQFWVIRFTEQAGNGRIIDEQECDGLSHPEPCRSAIERRIKKVLDSAGRKQLDRVCEAKPGERATLRRQPAWRSGPLSLAVEQEWVDQHCGAGALPVPNP